MRYGDRVRIRSDVLDRMGLRGFPSEGKVVGTEPFAQGKLLVHVRWVSGQLTVVHDSDLERVEEVKS